jgi:hypothetical protein
MPGTADVSMMSHAVFHETSSNNVVLRSSDGQVSRFRRAHLEAKSEVFEDIFSFTAAHDSRKKTQDGPIVDLADNGKISETFLLFLHPRREP